MKDSYLEFLLLREIVRKEFLQEMSAAWRPRDEMRPTFVAALHSGLRRNGYQTDHTYDKMIDDVLGRLQSSGAMAVDGDDYSGYFFKLVPGAYENILRQLAQGNGAGNRIRNLGPQALTRALAAIAAEDGWLTFDQPIEDLPDELLDQRVAPAADRIVSFDHNSNEAKILDKDLDAMSEALRGDNEGRLIPSVEKPRFLAQIKAARDLLKTGRVSSRAIYILLFPLLTYLAEKFGDEIVGQLASALLKALASLLGIQL